jgi:hypothetical protein
VKCRDDVGGECLGRLVLATVDVRQSDGVDDRSWIDGIEDALGSCCVAEIERDRIVGRRCLVDDADRGLEGRRPQESVAEYAARPGDEVRPAQVR